MPDSDATEWLDLDGARLELRTRSPPSEGEVRGVAVLAHPLGRLGGSMDDRVLAALETQANQMCYQTVCFNSRGVGQSTGSASWTGATECSDAKEVVRAALDAFERDFPDARDARAVIIGYSAGAMYGSTVSLPELLKDRPQFRRTTPAYVLVSYPVDMVWALSIFRSATYNKAIHAILEAKCRLLLVHGTHDQFSKTANYDKWTTELQPLASNAALLKVVSVISADHFWPSPLLTSLLSSVRDFL